MTHERSSVTVLTSGVGLGVYVPALLNARALARIGERAEVEVLEGYYTPDKLAQHLAHKAAYANSFELALLAHRATRSVTECLDEPRIEALLARWAGEGRTHFIVWSGFWLPVLERYQQLVPGLEIDVDLCRIDAIVSASFRIQRPLKRARCREIWLWNWEARQLGWFVPVAPDLEPIGYEKRSARLVVHGGGWALGGYRELLPELAADSRHALDVLSPMASDWQGRRAQDRAFRPVPQWHPWHREPNGSHGFPPLDFIDEGGGARALPRDEFAPAHSLVRSARAIVSKPGGGTLIDSLAAATPVVLLPPYGDAEARNGELWEQLGFGIRHERWRQTGYDPNVLHRLHENLLNAAPASQLPSFPLDAVGRRTGEAARRCAP